MKPYSLDLRKKIVESVKKGVPKAETARHFGVDRATVKRYSKQLDERGTLQASEEGSWQEAEARREGHQAARRRSRRAALGYPLPEGGVPLCGFGGEGERIDGLPDGRTSA